MLDFRTRISNQKWPAIATIFCRLAGRGKHPTELCSQNTLHLWGSFTTWRKPWIAWTGSSPSPSTTLSRHGIPPVGAGWSFRPAKSQTISYKSFTPRLFSPQEYDTLYTLGATVTYDCIWVREELRNARQNIHDHGLEPLEDFRDIVVTRVFNTWLELDNIVQETRQVWGFVFFMESICIIKALQAKKANNFFFRWNLSFDKHSVISKVMTKVQQGKLGQKYRESWPLWCLDSSSSCYSQKYPIGWPIQNYNNVGQYRAFREEHVRDFYFRLHEALDVTDGGYWRHYHDANVEVQTTPSSQGTCTLLLKFLV